MQRRKQKNPDLRVRVHSDPFSGFEMQARNGLRRRMFVARKPVGPNHHEPAQ